MAPEKIFSQKLSEEPFRTLMHELAFTANAQGFAKVLTYLPKEKFKFSSPNLQDDLGRNVLMWAVANIENTQLVLERAKNQGDLAMLLFQKVSNYRRCLIYACMADNIEVVRLFIEVYSFNWKNDRRIITRQAYSDHLTQFFSSLEKPSSKSR